MDCCPLVHLVQQLLMSNRSQAHQPMRADCYPDLSQLVAVNGTLLVGATALLSYVLAPAALLYAVLGLWEHYCTNLRDLTNCLPLPPGRMGLPVVGEMFHFFILVSTLSFFVLFFFCSRRARSGIIYARELTLGGQGSW